MIDVSSSVEILLANLYDENIDSLKNGYFSVEFNGHNFDISALEGSYENSFYTLIHHILFINDLYREFCDELQMRDIADVINENPSLPPAIPPSSNADSSADEYWNDLCNDAMEFTYNYLKKHNIECDEYEVFNKDYGMDW